MFSHSHRMGDKTQHPAPSVPLPGEGCLLLPEKGCRLLPSPSGRAGDEGNLRVDCRGALSRAGLVGVGVYLW